jgi:hypothetical protein
LVETFWNALRLKLKKRHHVALISSLQDCRCFVTGKVGVELWEFATYPHHSQAHSRERLCASGFSTFHFRRATEEFASVRIV